MVKLTTWLAMGAAATVTSASVAAGAVLYRGTLYADESILISWYIKRQERKNKNKQQQQPTHSSVKKVRKVAQPLAKGVQGAAENMEIDPVLRRRAVPTAMKALGISTAMALTVGSLCAALLTYAVEGGGGGAGDTDETQTDGQQRSLSAQQQQQQPTTNLPQPLGEGKSEVAKDDDAATPRRTIRQFLTESFKGK